MILHRKWILKKLVIIFTTSYLITSLMWFTHVKWTKYLENMLDRRMESTFRDYFGHSSDVTATGNKSKDMGKSFCSFQLPVSSPWYEWNAVDLPITTYLLSAYLEQEGSTYSIVIIGMSSKQYEGDHFCRIWSADLKVQITKMALGNGESDSHVKKYHGWYYICKFNIDEIHQPGFVSVVEAKCQPPSYFLVLQNAQHPSAVNHVTIKATEAKQKVNFTVCLSPLNLNYNNHWQLIEWIEVNRMFGVERFIVYIYSSGATINNVLNHYKKDGILEMIPWKIPVAIKKGANDDLDIHYYGQTIALNDCKYRSKNYSRFVMNVDVDEIIVPRNSSKYMDMLSRLELSVGETNLYLVRNTFFRIDWSQGFFSKINSTPLLEMQKNEIFQFDARTLWITKRESRIYAAGSRSKLIVGTLNPVWLTIHDAENAREAFLVPENEGLLHHYRPRMWKTWGLSQVEDTYMHRFSDEILSRLRKVYNEIKVPLVRNTPEPITTNSF